MDLSHFLILALATWRISSLFTSDNENGPFEILDYVRWHGRKISGAFECLWCASMWIGIILTVTYYIVPAYTTWLCLPFAFSAIAIAWERYNG
jgi:hypothetical protein